MNIINQSENSLHMGFPVEGLLRSFFNKKHIFFHLRKELILKRYMGMPRNIDKNKKIVARPIDFFDQSLDTIIDNIPNSVNHSMLLFAYCFENFSMESNKQYWAVCDTYPEFIFTKIKKKLPEIKLICMVRDPREVISSGLFWRTYPERSKKKADKLKYRLLLWLLSIDCIIKLSKKFKGDISIICFSDNLNLQSYEFVESDYSTFVKSYLKNKIPYYTFNKGKFYSMDGDWEKMLKENEINFIEKFCDPYLKNKNKNKNKNSITIETFLFKLLLALSILLSNISYNTSRNFIGFIYAFNHKKVLFSILESVKQFFVDLFIILKNNLILNHEK